MAEGFEKYLDKISKDDLRKQDKIKKNKEKIDDKIFEFKVDKLNHIMDEKNIDFRFHIKRVDDHYEFSVPITTLFGPATRKFAANKWKDIMKEAGIEMDFSEEIEEVMEQIKGITVIMKLNHRMNAEVGEGRVEVDGKEVD